MWGSSSWWRQSIHSWLMSAQSQSPYLGSRIHCSKIQSRLQEGTASLQVNSPSSSSRFGLHTPPGTFFWYTSSMLCPRWHGRSSSWRTMEPQHGITGKRCCSWDAASCIGCRSGADKARYRTLSSCSYTCNSLSRPHRVKHCRSDPRLFWRIPSSYHTLSKHSSYNFCLALPLHYSPAFILLALLAYSCTQYFLWRVACFTRRKKSSWWPSNHGQWDLFSSTLFLSDHSSIHRSSSAFTLLHSLCLSFFISRRLVRAAARVPASRHVSCSRWSELAHDQGHG